MSNVIGRVTGGAASSIDGSIKSAIPGANLYLVNPAGVVFGPNATVDVGGSFHASSADYLRMKDGTRFQATNPNDSTLSAAPPEAFGFLSASPQPVTVNGSNLQLAPRNTLGVVGGAVTISGGRLYAPSGTVHVASAAGPGEMPVDPRAGPAPTVARSGRVQVANNTSILASGENGGAGGSVFIRAGDLSVSASDIGADNGGPGPGGVLSLRGDRTVTISNGATVRADAIGTGRGADLSISTAAGGTMVLDAAKIRTVTFAAGDGGTVAINTGALTLRNGAKIISQAQDRGNGGPITVAADSVLLDGTGTNFGSGSFGAGAGGSVSVVAAQDVTVGNDANIQASASSTGAGGSIGIMAAGNVTISGGTVVSSAAEGSAATVVVGDVTITANGVLSLDQNSFIAANSIGANNASTIRITAGEMTVADGASIQGLASSTGRGADILINVAGNFSLTGTGTTPSNIADDSRGPGNAGNVTINAGALTLSRGGAIGSTAGGSGNAGEITLNVKGALTIDGAGDEGFANGVTSASDPGSSGLAGTVRVSAGSLSVLNGGFIKSSTAGSGQGGNITVNVGSVSLANGGTITSSTQGTGAGGSVLVTTLGALLLDGNRSDYTQITASALGRQSGDAGTITITAGSVTVQNGAQIASSTAGLGRGGGMAVNAGALNLVSGGTITSNTFGSGDAGEITLNVTGPLVIDGAHEEGFTTGVSSDAYLGTSGAAGPVQVNAANVSLLNGGSIDSRARGIGVGGSIVISTPGALLLDGGGGTTTEIAVSARGRQSGNAGTIMVSAGTVAVQGGAQIATTTTGPGRGGDVAVTAGSAVRLNGPGPQINATATGTGAAGSISVAAPQVFLRDGASVSTAAQSSNGGNITIGPGDLLYLQQSSITTSVSGASGNGGNITVEPQLVVLDHSTIQANAVGGNGGNVQVQANQLVQSFDSAITATSQRGVSGEIFVTAQPVNLNGSLVVLASELRAAAALLREGCAARGAAPRSSLVVAGRGGQRQGLEATLPALYFAHRPVRNGGALAAAKPAAAPPETRSASASARPTRADEAGDCASSRANARRGLALGGQLT